MGTKSLFHIKSLNRGVSIAPLVVFRILFGALLFFGTARFMLKGWVADNYITPDFHFTFFGFDWIEPLNGYWMYLPFILLLIASIGIMLGAFYKLNTLLAFLCFTYIELLDKTFYLNHYYFVSLVLFLLIFIPAHHSLSLDLRWSRIKERKTVANINVKILQFQLACVYIFAAVAKLESDWLVHAEPLKTWLNPFSDTPVIGGVLSSEITAYVFAWFGLIYDATIVFFLLRKSTRKWAYIAVVVFHVTTWLLFPIGVFPWVMIASTTIFFSSSFHEKILNRIFNWKQIEKDGVAQLSLPKLRVALIGVFVFFQLAIPFRHVLYPGNVFWNEEGFRFSWRVMLMHKVGNAAFYVVDPKTGGEIEIVNEDYLTEKQIEQMSTQPDMILQFAHLLKDSFSDTTLVYGNQSVYIDVPEVHADVKVYLNGRKGLQFIEKKHNLADFNYNLRHREWLNEFSGE